MSDYNGYPNRATWNVSLWLNNEEYHYRALQAMAKEAEDADALATAIEEYCSEVWQGGLTPDGDKLAACDFDFIAKNEWEDAHYIPKPTPFELENTLYECGICDCLHPWAFDGDCRDDANRYGDAEDYATKKQVNIYAVTVRSWEERQAARQCVTHRTANARSRYRRSILMVGTCCRG